MRGGADGLLRLADESALEEQKQDHLLLARNGLVELGDEHERGALQGGSIGLQQRTAPHGVDVGGDERVQSGAVVEEHGESLAVAVGHGEEDLEEGSGLVAGERGVLEELHGAEVERGAVGHAAEKDRQSGEERGEGGGGEEEGLEGGQRREEDE